MDIFDTTQLALTAGMHGASLRQQALSDNLANVDTPGYVRKDVDFQDALRSALQSGADPESVSFSIQPDASAPVRADGNSVDIDQESSDLAENTLTYESLAQVASSRIQILQSAMGVS